MGLLKRARSILRASRSDRSLSKGLLGKSLEILNNILPSREDTFTSVPAAAEKKTPESVPLTWKESGQPVPEEPEEISDDQRHQRVLAGLEEIEEGIEAPGRLFSLLTEHLGLNRAALLLYDPVRLVFAPWALHGFDQTTNRRLRIPLGANETMNRLASGRVYLLTDQEELLLFQQFFSFREFSTLNHLLLVPFIQASRFMGLLLIADMEAQAEQDNLEVFKTLADRASGLFYRARERHLEGARRGVPEQPDALRESVRSALQPYLDKGESPLMIRINTTKLIESVQQRNSYTDPFRLDQDISRIIFSVFQSVGPVFQIDRKRILVLVTRGTGRISAQDSDLLLDHLKGTLLRLLPELSDGENIDLDEQVRSPGPDIEEVFTFLAEMV